MKRNPTPVTYFIEWDVKKAEVVAWLEKGWKLVADTLKISAGESQRGGYRN